MASKTTKELINEMRSILNNQRNLTLESLVFSKESAEEPYYDDEKYGSRDDFREENTSDNIKSLINQIRKLVLNGIAQLAEHPESSEYEMLKKIWSVVDKASEQPQADKNSRVKPKENY